jgi:hypothetical protein
MRSRSSARFHSGRTNAALLTTIAVAIAASTAWVAPIGASSGTPAPKVKSAVNAGRAVEPDTAAVIARADRAVNAGFCGGDDWEPEITVAPDRHHVYFVWTHFPGDPTCDPASANPNRVYIRASSDGGRTFGPPHVVANTISGVVYPQQVDNVVAVDPVTEAVYVSFLAFGLHGTRTDVAVAKSTDFGAHFTAVKVNGPLCFNCDHPWTVAYGPNVYTAYAHNGEHYLTRSADGGKTWVETDVENSDSVAFPEGAVMDANHNVYVAWGDCTTPNCSGNAAGDYRVSSTTAGTSNTTFADVATAPAGPVCPYRPQCGFAFFGVQDDIAIDAAGTLYLVWQDGQDHATAESPPIVQLSRSDDLGKTWTYVGRVDDKTASGCAASSCYALFPRIAGNAPGQIAVMWMDDRLGLPVNHENGWNVWLRESVTGGASWTGPSTRMSTFDASRPQSEPNGFRFPYGDYQSIDLLPARSSTQAVMIWGEGINYAGGAGDPGAVVYRRVKL